MIGRFKFVQDQGGAVALDEDHVPRFGRLPYWTNLTWRATPRRYAASAMQYLARNPPPALATFIERNWSCSDAPAYTRERVLPGAHVDLVFNLVDDEIRSYRPEDPGTVRAHAGAVVRGTSTRSFVMESKQRASSTISCTLMRPERETHRHQARWSVS